MLYGLWICFFFTRDFRTLSNGTNYIDMVEKVPDNSG